VKTRLRVGFFLFVAAASIAAAFSFGPRAQDSSYHAFADTRTLLGVPNALNVLSNAGFLASGILGLMFLLADGGARSRAAFEDPSERGPWGVAFAGVVLTALGSSYYHLAPDDARLFWDRLPMTIVFGSLLAAVIAERVDGKAGRVLLVPLVLAATASAVYWRVTGDLRPYIVAQFFPVVGIPLLLGLFPPRYTGAGYWVGLILWYGVAKAAEALDASIYSLGHIVSGHSLKHVAAAAGTWWLVVMLKRRKPAV
jgi:hypothetical protein